MATPPADPARPRDPPEESGSTGAVADPLLGLVVGGRYRILARLGRGGMGMVYRVEHVKLGKLLALKLLSGELSREPGVLRRFEREALAASRLSHPNTVQVFDYGTSDGLTWLVMELVKGQDLSRALKAEGPLHFVRVVRLLVQVCGSLSEAHSKGIVHRDIKPGNVMVTYSMDGEEMAKVLDFGLAKLREGPDLNEVTGRGMVLGTPAYMAPEQIEGRPVDGRTDIYALGAMAYRLLTGKAVFPTSRSAREVFTRHLTEVPEPPHQRAPHLGIPEALGAAVMRCLEKRPEARFQSVDELRAALLQAITPEEPSSPSLIDEPTVPIPLVHPENATRDEVASFERKLVRQRRVAQGLLAAGLLGALYGAFLGLRAYTAPPVFDGLEAEPNNAAAQANELPLGRTISGTVGKRLSPEQPDVDFFRLAVPPGSDPLSLRLTGLPNMSLCALLFASNEPQPLARLCTGRSHLDLIIPRYRLAPGGYYLAVTQDHSGQGVVENVSDAYHLTVERASTDQGDEQEPNDEPMTASPVEPGSPVRGRLGWVNDVDTLCASAAAGPTLRWQVDYIPALGSAGAELEITQTGGHDEQIARVHPSGAGQGPWTSAPFAAGPGQCVRLRRVLALPQGPEAQRPPLSHDGWVVRLSPS